MSLLKPIGLVIDDEPMDSRILSSLLKKVGITPVSLFSEAEVSRKISEIDFDLCLVDLNVGDFLNGFPMIGQIRSVLGDQTLIIVVSGRSDIQTVSRALELGADDFVSKPVDLNLLASRLARRFHTQELEVYQSPSMTVPSSLSPIQIQLDCGVLEINEQGIQLMAESYVETGTVIQVSGSLISAIAGREGSVPFTVTSSVLTQDGKTFIVSAEFEKGDEKLLSSVRHWLSVHKIPKGKLPAV